MITLARFPDRSAVLFEDPEQRDTPWHDEKETALFGSTHTDIGAYLLNWWGLPFALMEASRYHHIPEDPRVVNRELVSVIHLADCLAWELLGMPPRHGINPFALHQLGLDIEPLRALVDQDRIPCSAKSPDLPPRHGVRPRFFPLLSFRCSGACFGRNRPHLP
jgi:HD-like signal output (HDOD) protein